MARLKVLFADDQIPNEDIPDIDVPVILKKKYPGIDPAFINAFLPMRQAVKTIRDGYDVTIANTYEEALGLIRKTHFDIAIVDLRWDADENVPRETSDNAGWAICDAIEEADKNTQLIPTFQIVYSSRFASVPYLAFQAAQKLKLPVYKSYDEPGRQALLAAVNFIEKYLSYQSAQKARATEDELFQVMDVPDDFYKKIISEINQLYQNGLVFALSVLIRKLFENLIIDILRKQYGKQGLSLYFDTSRCRFHDFSILIKNFKDKQADFKSITDNLNNKVFDEINRYRETGNSGAHSIDANMTLEQFKEKKKDLNYHVQLLFRIYKNIPS